jgi:uncharacterized protein (DUF362 family)
MKRRAFIRDVAVGGLVLHMNPHIIGQSRLPDMSIVEGDSPAAITREAIKALGGMQRFVSKGDRVLVKPNIGWDRTPEQAACTNPQVIETIIQLCFDAGAKEVKVTDNPCNPARRTYQRSGIAEAAKKAGAKVPFPNDHKLKKTPLNGEWLKDWEIYLDFLETDKIINVPIAKNHSLSRVTLSMKNWLGALGGNRNQLHQNLDAAMLDLSAFFKPVLTVLDGYRVLMRNGPQGGRLSDVKMHKTVAASADFVAIDTLGARFLEVNPEELRYLKMAKSRGLGENDLEKLTIEKKKI